MIVFHFLPVSYTHLDVYKRQALTKPTQAIGKPSFNINISAPLIMNCTHNTNSIIKATMASIALNSPAPARPAIVEVMSIVSATFKDTSIF